jgi:tRNA (cytidine/uridine-2'-O-)-methyltransferase
MLKLSLNVAAHGQPSRQMFNVVLFEPEIPGNTGNIIRLCANTGARLHLLGRLGFTLEEAQLRRAGLDYHDLVDVHRHADLAACVASLRPARLVVIETGAPRWLSELDLQPQECLLFGPETRGLPADVGAGLGVEILRASLPMRPSNRSLNLANAVAVTVYEAWRQQGFAGAIRTPP